MALIYNNTTEFGDIIFIKTDIPAIGISALIGFTDDTLNENDVNYYKKTFQYSLNGLSWSDWQDLTLENIQAVQVSSQDTLYLNYKYEQRGQGLLTFNSATVDATYVDRKCGPYYNESIFKKYFDCNDIEVFKWYINVTEKIYTTDLNKYVFFDNGHNNANDAIYLWQSVARFFAYYVILARTYRNFYQNIEILNSYLIQRGLYTSTNNTLVELNSLMKNYVNEISRRGTRNILLKKENNNNLYDGELRRFLNVNENSELIFDQFLPYQNGWWVDSSSPLYRGLDGHFNANKFDYENYSTIGTVTKTIIDNDTIYNVVGDSSGAGFLANNQANLININTYNNYCIEFEIEVISDNTTITFGTNVFDIGKNQINNGTRNFKDNSFSNYFISDLSLSRLKRVGGYFPMKAIIYNTEKPSPFSQDMLNINAGNNLKFSSAFINKLYPTILIKNGTVNIKNLVVRPLETEYERGFIHVNHWIGLWVDNSIIV